MSLRLSEEQLEQLKIDNPNIRECHAEATESPQSGVKNGKSTKRHGNKYGAVKTESRLCKRIFDSKAECKRGEWLKLLELDGQISNLEYQPKWILNEKKPRITVALDFAYKDSEGNQHYEDVKGVLTRDSRTKYAWLKEKYGIQVEIIKKVKKIKENSK